MAETKLVVEHREQLWSLLIEAAQFEHLIMCQYLYACFSLKTEPDEGLTAEQADAVARWQGILTGIAIEEMLHLALVTNVMTAIGAGPSLSRPNFPRHSDFLPRGAEFALLPFGGDALMHFLYLERPEGMGNFVPWREPAWVLLAERAAVLARECADCAAREGVPAAVGSAATAAVGIAQEVAGHVTPELRPA